MLHTTTPPLPESIQPHGTTQGLRECLEVAGYPVRPGADGGPVEIACGRIVAIEIEGSAAAADVVEALARERFEPEEPPENEPPPLDRDDLPGRVLARRAGGGHRTLMLRTNAPFASLSRTLLAPDGTLATISILGRGGYVLAYGGLPAFATPWLDPGCGAWPVGLSPLTVDADELALIRDADEARAFLTNVVEVLIVENGFTTRRSKAKTNGDDAIGPEPPPHPGPGAPAAAAVPAVHMKSSAEFVKGFVPPDYVVVGLLQRRFFYSLTAPTGHGKTAIMLVLAASTALGTIFAGKVTKPTRVLYLAAENADDVRMRWIALAQRMGFDIDTIEVYFIEGRFTLSTSLKLLRAEAERVGGEFGLVIVDTGPTFFEGKEENENKQYGDHARLLRSLMDTIPGAPCVVAACHPIKNAAADNLIPRGGGAFLNEVDGNLTCWKTDSAVELHWQGKFRGPDFAPVNFLIETVTHQDLKDSDGRLIPTVVAAHISEQAKDDIAAAALDNENRALQFIDQNPALTQVTLAVAMGWKMHDGEPYKMKAKRLIDKLLKAKLIKENRTGGYKITPDGTKALKGETEE